MLLWLAGLVALAGALIKLKSVAVELLLSRLAFLCARSPFSSPTLARGSEPVSSSIAPFDGRHGCFLRTGVSPSWARGESAKPGGACMRT